MNFIVNMKLFVREELKVLLKRILSYKFIVEDIILNVLCNIAYFYQI